MAHDHTRTARLRNGIIRKIRDLVATHPANLDEAGFRYFDAPLVGFAAASDELFIEYKRIIGPFHWTPQEALDQVLMPGEAGAGTVVCWILPIGEPIRRSNASQEKHPSLEWARTRDFGEKFNNLIRREIVDFITDRDGRAIAPMLSNIWSRVRGSKTGTASTWSERHAAYAAGLGTFSINDGFITRRGIAHRCGSVVTDIVMAPSRRPYTDHLENCLLARGLECGVCISRCPCRAISLSNHDKERCECYYEHDFGALHAEYGVSVTGCGLCQTGVPCESSIPKKSGSNVQR